MQNAMNEKKNEWTATGKSVVDRAVSEVKNLNPEDIKRTATEFTAKVRDASTEYYDDAISYVRRNPVSAALGLCAFGFVAGVITGMMKKSA
jgi:hypothetical protein